MTNESRKVRRNKALMLRAIQIQYQKCGAVPSVRWLAKFSLGWPHSTACDYIRRLCDDGLIRIYHPGRGHPAIIELTQEGRNGS